ncbi:MAG: prepilin-type N-terminal cleavage/methylation domain-containing protein [Myxococcota bacterium]
MTRHAPARGFTIIELIIGMTVALIIFSAASEILVQVENFRRLSRARTQLLMDARLALTYLERDLAAAGQGAPEGSRINAGATVAGFSTLVPPIMPFSTAARADPSTSVLTTGNSANKKFVLVADLPRPDSNFDGFSNMSDDSPASNKLVVLNELSGQCDSTNANCGTRLGSLTNADCTAATGLSCPWALRKYTTTGGGTITGATSLQMIFPKGNFENVTLSSVTANTNPVTLNLSAGYTGGDPLSPFATARVAQFDTVGYRIQSDGTLQRRQCWGAITPEAAGFADFDGTPTPCTTNADTGWLTIARNVYYDDSSFDYYANTGSTTQDPDEVVAVGIRLHMRRTISVGKSTRYNEYNAYERFRLRALSL